MAMIIPASTNTTIATCIQIQVGDMRSSAYFAVRVPAGGSLVRRANNGITYGAPGMSERLGRLTTALALGLCGLACFAPTGGADDPTNAHSSSAAPLGGVNIPGLSPSSLPADADRAIAEAQALHAKIVRIELPWSVLEPRGANLVDPHALAFTDRLVEDAAGAGIRVIAMVDSSPCWASSAPASLLRSCSPRRSTQANAWPPSKPAEYAAFVGYLAQRYGTRLAAIEVWNEPDQANQAHFAGPDKAQRYAAILRAAYPAIKQANPRVPVLAGSLVGSNGVFLRALYAAGIKGYYDGLSVHFYTLTLAALRAIHEVQLANGDTKPLWLDEFGWSSCWPQQLLQQEQACVTAQTQATNITDVFRSLARTPYVAAEVVYKLQGSTTEEFGVFSASGARKPAFAALAQAFVSPFGGVSRVTVSLRRRGSRVVASGSGPVGDFMELEAFQGKVLRYRAEFTLDRFNRYSIVLPRALGSHDLRVRVYQYWSGLARASTRSV
jgi:hypothetical protein